jgi:hypothetical protein
MSGQKSDVKKNCQTCEHARLSPWTYPCDGCAGFNRWTAKKLEGGLQLPLPLPLPLQNIVEDSEAVAQLAAIIDGKERAIRMLKIELGIMTAVANKMLQRNISLKAQLDECQFNAQHGRSDEKI